MTQSIRIWIHLFPALFLLMACGRDNRAKIQEPWTIAEWVSGMEAVARPSGNRFFVDPVLGDDANDGTLDSPWRTLSVVLTEFVSTRQPESFPATEDTPLVPRNPQGPVKPGDVIVLRGGHHGSLEIFRARNEDFIAIVAMEGEVPVVERVSMVASSRWILEGLAVTQDAAEEPSKVDLLEVREHNWSGPAHEIIVRDCRFSSTADAGAWTKEDWNEKACNGAILTGTRILLENNQFLNVNFGITVSGNFTDVIGNTVENFAGDGLRGLGHDLVFRSNVVKNCYDVNENHDDGFQSWSIDGVPPRRVVLDGNLFVNYTDPDQPFRGELQGIGCFDGFHEDWYVANNVVIVDHWHGITFLGADNVTVIHNTVVNRNPDSGLTPWILVTDHKDGRTSRNSLVANNLVANRITAGDGVLETGNMVVTDAELEVFFTAPGELDYSLTATSPARDAAETLDICPPHDFLGISRPQGAGFDTGAFEFPVH